MTNNTWYHQAFSNRLMFRVTRSGEGGIEAREFSRARRYGLRTPG